MKDARTKNATSARRRNQGGATDEGAEPRQRPVVHRDPAEKATDQKAERREHVDKIKPPRLSLWNATGTDQTCYA